MGNFDMHLNLSGCTRILAFLVRGLAPVSLSIYVIGVDRIAPVIKRSGPWRFQESVGLPLLWLTTLWRHAWDGVWLFNSTLFFSMFSLASMMGSASLQRMVRWRLVSLLSMWHQDLLLPHSLLWSSTKSDGPVLLLWGQGEQGGGGLGLVNGNVSFVSPAA